MTTEVTQMWNAVMAGRAGYTPTLIYGVGDHYPAYYVSWYDAIAFASAFLG